MSHRFGMADGRCFTFGTSDRLLNDYIMKTNGIQYQDNYAYRRFLQANGPSVVRNIQDSQQPMRRESTPTNFANQCQACSKPLLNVAGIY